MARPLKKDAYDAAPRDLGRYRLHGEIASGGMATVHFGRQVGTGGFSKTVAIKRLHPQFGKMPEFVSMFLAEARLAARIRHPNIVQPLDVLTVDDEIFLVMEYVEGDSLSRLMRATQARKERVPVPIAMSIICGMLHGLHAAHEAKSDKGEPLELVHRDVSPQNILVGIDGVPRVIDFGIAKAADSVQFTRDGELKGKLSYMAPEQLNGHRCTRRSDIYASAVVLWEVLTAQRLFDADYQSAILQNILHRPVDPPSDIVQDLPKAVDRIVLKALSRDPSDRYATARDMALAIEESIPLATQSSVGSWVEVVAAKSLGQRAARVAEIESVPSSNVDEEQAEEIVSEMISPSRRREPEPMTPTPEPQGSFRSTLSSPGNRARNSAPQNSAELLRLPFAKTEALDMPPPVPPAPPPPPPSARPSRSPSERADTSVLSVRGGASSGVLGSTLPLGSSYTRQSSPGSEPRPPPPTIQVDGPTSAPQWPVPGIPASVTGDRVAAGSAKRSTGGGMVVFLLLLIVGVAGFFIVLPEFLKRGYVSGAARAYGATLTIDNVQVTFHEVRLVGVNATVHEMPGVTLRCESIEIPLTGLSQTQLTAHDVLLTLDGPYPLLSDSFSRWDQAHPRAPDKGGDMRSMTLDSGHIVWTRPFGEQTTFEAENISGTVERTEGRPLGDDYRMNAAIATLSTTSGKIGPWQVKVETANRVIRTTMALDPSGASRAQVALTVKDGAVASVLATVPSTPLGQLGLGALGIRQDQPIFVQADAQYSVSPGAHVEGRLRASASGTHVNAGLTPSQVEVDLHFDGDPKLPIDLGDGTITVTPAPFRARPTGTLTLGSGFVKVELAWRAGTVRCANGGEQSLASTLHFDSHSLDSSTWAVGGSRCVRAAP
jgi:eukaryotic-like serine/threonine-protein kinase